MALTNISRRFSTVGNKKSVVMSFTTSATSEDVDTGLRRVEWCHVNGGSATDLSCSTTRDSKTQGTDGYFAGTDPGWVALGSIQAAKTYILHATGY